MDTKKLLKYDWLGRHHWWLTSKYTVLSDMLNHFYKETFPQRILDIGCGSGVFVEYLKNFNSNIFGIDISPQILALLRQRNKGIQVAAADAARLPLKDNSFDLISLIDVLEHMDDDRKLISDIGRLLKPCGILLLSVPAYNALYGNHDRLYGHKRRYRRRQLANTLRDEGFEIIRATYFQPAFVLPLWIKRKFFSGDSENDDFLPVHKSINSLLNNILCLEKYFLRRFDIPFGTTLICVARKP